MLLATSTTSSHINSTTVRSEMSTREFQLRALALQLPILNRAQRAADLFCTPLPGTRARAERAIAQLETSSDAANVSLRTISHNGVDYQCYVTGNPLTQPYWLCSHGWSSLGLRFAPWFAAAQAAGFAAISFDHVAHGRTSKQRATFQGFIDGISAMRAHFGEPSAAIGHSLGAAGLAMSAAENALRAPLVLIAPPASLRRAVEFFARRCKLNDAAIEAIIQELSTRVGRALDDYRLSKFGTAIRQRVLVIHDFEDTDVNVSAGLSYAMLAPNAQMICTTGLGHHKILNDAATLSTVQRFLAGDTVGEKLKYSAADLDLALS
jgi:hypothetical protein